MKHVVVAVMMALTPVMALAEGVMHKVAIHVDENDPAVMNMALNNAKNVASYYASVGDQVEIELVAYGPGLNMFVEGKSPVADRLAVMTMEMPMLTLSACGNTHQAMSAKAGMDVPLLSDVGIVPSGVVRLIELQEAGYAYVRP